MVKRIQQAAQVKEQRKDLAREIRVGKVDVNKPIDLVKQPARDRLILIVRDSYWIHASWELTRPTVDRARASLAEQWHTVKPVLRLYRSDPDGTTNTSEAVFHDIEVHGGVRNWYIDIPQPPATIRAEIGYLAENNRFHELVASNVVTTAAPGSPDSISEHWADIQPQAERIFALSGGYNEEVDTRDLKEMFEEKFKRPMGAPSMAQFGSGAETGFRRSKNFFFEVDAELLVHGATSPGAYVTISGEPVKLEEDGSFVVRLPLPDRRQVLPIIAATRDGVDEQTVVIMIERNTKVLEPLSKESDDSP